MYQSPFLRNNRNQYLYKLALLNQLADVTGIEPAQLVAYISRLQQTNPPKEALRIHQQTAISENIQ